MKNETLWVTQKAMSGLFDVGQSAITKHLKNIFEKEELEEKAVYSKMEYTASDGKNYQTGYYNLDAIISVGYRVNSQKATHFRQWATSVLKTYLQKGYLIDSEQMEQGGTIFGKDYYREMLETVRAIRASEWRIWL